jgi:hypothetical protein
MMTPSVPTQPAAPLKVVLPKGVRARDRSLRLGVLSLGHDVCLAAPWPDVAERPTEWWGGGIGMV